MVPKDVRGGVVLHLRRHRPVIPSSAFVWLDPHVSKMGVRAAPVSYPRSPPRLKTFGGTGFPSWRRARSGSGLLIGLGRLFGRLSRNRNRGFPPQPLRGSLSVKDNALIKIHLQRVRRLRSCLSHYPIVSATLSLNKNQHSRSKNRQEMDSGEIRRWGCLFGCRRGRCKEALAAEGNNR